MSADAGYIYALINPAMPTLVKVGRTNRAVEERLAELSAASGVPSPFVLVYDVLVPDAAKAEQYLHRLLTDLGYRVSANREFFDAPIREVLRVMIHMREAMESATLGDRSEGGKSPYARVLFEQKRDDLFLNAAEVCVKFKRGSAALLQKRLHVGYGRAARIIDQLHSDGVLGPPNGSKDREVLLGLEDLDRYRS